MRNLFFLFFLLISTTNFAQKVKIKNYNFDIDIRNLEKFKNIKTYSYKIQDDGNYWNHIKNKDKFPTLESYTKGIFIDHLKSVKENGDLKIIVGYLGRDVSEDDKKFHRGTARIVLLVNKDSLVYEKEINLDINNFPNSSSFLYNLNKERAIVLTKLVQKHIDDISFLFTIKPYKLPFGLLYKGKNENAINYAKHSEVFLNEIKKNPSRKKIKEVITFLESQNKIDLGKKLKEKHKNRLIYSSLTTLYILLKEFEKARVYERKLNLYSSFFNNYTLNLDNLFRDYDFSNQFKTNFKNRIDTTGNFMYENVFINKGNYIKENEKVEFDKVIVQKLIPRTEREEKLISLKIRIIHEKPTVKLYREGKLKHTFNAKINHSIIFENGNEIKFISEKGVNIPHLYKLDKSVIKL